MNRPPLFILSVVLGVVLFWVVALFVISRLVGHRTRVVSGTAMVHTTALPLDENLSFQASLTRGDRYYAQGDYGNARHDYSHMIELEPNRAEGYRLRGMADCKLEDFTRAIEDETKAIQLETRPEEMPVLYYQRGLGYKGLWQKEKALADFEEAIRRDPKYYDAYVERGSYRMMDGDNARALADYNVVLGKNPKNAKVWMLRGQTYLQKVDIDRALADVNRSIALDPKSAPAYALRSRLYDNKKQYAKALSDAQKAAEIEPTNASYWNVVGWFVYETGKPAEAIPLFEKAQHLDDEGGKDNPMYIRTPYMPLNQGLCYAVLGDAEASARFYRGGLSVSLEIVKQALEEARKELRKQPNSVALKQAVEILQQDVKARAR